MNDLEALKRLQANHLELTKARHELVTLGDSGKETEAALAKTRTLEAKAAEDLAKVQREVRSLEADVAELVAKRKKLEDRLSKATTNKAAEAVQHEISAQGEKVSAAEEALLAVMEREEEAASMCRRIAEAIEKLQGQARSIVDALPGRRATLEERIRVAEVEREKWRSHISPEDLERFDEQVKRARGGLVVVEVDDACVACDRSFIPSLRQTYMEHSDKAHVCPGCGALMIFEGAHSL